MSALGTAAIVLAVLLLSAAIGIRLRLPASHLESDSRDVVKSVLGLIATMTAMMLSLLVASAKSSYDAQVNELQEIAARLVLLDRTLANYGPDAASARKLLVHSAEAAVNRVWPAEGAPGSAFAPPAQRLSTESFIHQIGALSPRTDMQRAIQANALQISATLTQTRMLMYAQMSHSVPLAFLLILLSWLVVLFIGYGLFSQINSTVMIAFLIGALAVSGAVFLILELSHPYAGLLRIPDTVMRSALAMMGLP